MTIIWPYLRQGAAEVPLKMCSLEIFNHLKVIKLKLDFFLDRLNYAYVLSAKLNWNRWFVICNPLCPEKTYMHPRATVNGKLQQVGGQSPFCLISSHCRFSPLLKRFRESIKDMYWSVVSIFSCLMEIAHMSFKRAFPSYPA